MKSEKRVKKESLKDLGKFLYTVFKCAVFICIMCAMTSRISFGATLDFDDSGNLVYVTYDGTSTAVIKYRTIGWVLKRYDAPIDVKGQQYIVIPKRSGGNSYIDPDDPSVKYYVFTSDSKEILTAINKVSKEWKNQLVNYGGSVYIDSVMTVVEYGEEKGSVNNKGEMSGEVYITYNGIAGARGWGNPSILKQHYNIKVEYKAQTAPGEKSISYKKTSVIYDSAVACNTEVKSNSPGDEIFNVGVAIPGGEKVYAHSTASMYQYQVKMSKVDCVLNVPVKISTVYNITWKSYDGKNLSEKRKVDRYYMVSKEFSYYEYNSAYVYKLTKVLVNNAAIKGGGDSVSVGVPDIDIDYKKYGGVNSHVQYESMYEANTKQVNLSSNNYEKPNVPDEDYLEYAQSKVTNLHVHNDVLSIGGNVISSEKEYKFQTKSPIYFEPDIVISDILNLRIEEYCRNSDFNSASEFTYTSEGKQKKYTCDAGKIRVLTPVLSEMVIHSYIEDKNGVIVENEVNPGGTVWIEARGYGTYDKYTGYNMGKFNQYIKMTQVRFDCDVYRAGKKYQAGTWIEMGFDEAFEIAQDTKEGDYNVELRNYAVNYKSGDAGEVHTNGKKRLYYASATDAIHVKEKLEEEKEKEKDKIKITYAVVGTH